MAAMLTLPARTLTTRQDAEGAFRTTFATGSAKVQVIWDRLESSFFAATQRAGSLLPARESFEPVQTERKLSGRWVVVAGVDAPV